MTRLDDVYRARFDDRSRRGKLAVWAEITRYLQRYVDAEQPVLDVGCDHGYFVRHVVARERWGTDLRDVSADLPSDVHFIAGDGLKLAELVPRKYFGTVFMSNYLEHLPTSMAVLEQLHAAAEVTRPGGRLIILQPNIRLTGPAYWDFIDHHVALTDRSVEEGAQLAGYETVRLVARFLPYTTKGRLPQDPRLVRAYLAFPPAWRVLGRQSLYVGQLGG